MIPNKLSDWKYKTIKELVDKNINESDRHDFKTDIPSSEVLTKICCAFANTKGGFIVIGVKQRGSRFVIVGIDNDKDLAHKFGQKINASPTIDFDLPKILKIPRKDLVLAVFHIPLSPEKPHIPVKEDLRKFFKRTNRGNHHMSYEEIRMSFQNYEERREKIKLLYIELLSNIDDLESMKISDDKKDSSHSLITVEMNIIDSLLTDLYTIIGKNTELIRILFTIRHQTKVINNKIKIFYSQVSRPIRDRRGLTKEHNKFIDNKVNLLIPIIKKGIKILETDFNLRNPFEEIK